jgi:hypothetical protein
MEDDPITRADWIVAAAVTALIIIAFVLVKLGYHWQITAM